MSTDKGVVQVFSSLNRGLKNVKELLHEFLITGAYTSPTSPWYEYAEFKVPCGRTIVAFGSEKNSVIGMINDFSWLHASPLARCLTTRFFFGCLVCQS